MADGADPLRAPAIEVERKFLVTGDGWRAQAGTRSHIEQAYLARTAEREIRVRIIDGRDAVLTVKSARPDMIRREVECPLPPDKARELIAMADGRIEKYRHRIAAGGALCWEVDEFIVTGRSTDGRSTDGRSTDGQSTGGGLILAEIELPAPDTPFDRPDWLGREVTGDPAYYNAVLAGGCPQ
ncbi:CYTH domain-containing protein [Croceicoccus sp. Ery5]|uniref:CYTH domain-containing protein n=1 Tax=Croceicoccus sp. Ery5 TaxID=1703340 RepID=UPI001E2B0AD7|nr:CYTH domain-containing protein [Croceicoccus sp. Ery5]